MREQKKGIRGVVFGAAVILFLSSGLMRGEAGAFAEDVCQAYRGKGVITEESAVIPLPFNCYDLECTDGVDGGEEGAQCIVSGFGTLVLADMLYKLHGRNTLHFDVVWLLGRAAGLTATDAATLASYSQATDLGEYRHYDYQGNALPSFTSESIEGVKRTNYATFGFWLHYVPWFREEGETKRKLTYDFGHADGQSPFASGEVPLNHIRDWAFGVRDTLCTFGLTDSQGNCYGDPAQDQSSGRLNLYVPIVNPIAVQDQVTLGRQKIKPCADSSDQSCYNTDYDKANKGSIKALGIYLHAMDDRISHFQCSDFSAIEQSMGGASTSDEYTLNYAMTCGQLLHVGMHYRETGHSPVPARSINALVYTLLEIDDWIKVTGYDRDSSYVGGIEKYKTVAIKMVTEGLSQECAAARVQRLCQIARANDLGWHDNNATCEYQGLNCNAD